MTDPSRPSLSPQGQFRQREILELAQRVATTRRRWRIVARAAAITCLAAVAVMSFQRSELPPQFAKVPVPAQATQPSSAGPIALPSIALPVADEMWRMPITVLRPSQRPPIVITRIATDSTLRQRFAIARSKRDWQKIDDQTLLSELEQAGSSACISYAHGQPKLLVASAQPPWRLR